VDSASHPGAFHARWAKPLSIPDDQALQLTERDVSSLYLLAMAQNAEGGGKEAVETAHKALAMLPPSRSGRVYYVRTELEAIR
jgi:hypothetical protein